MLTRALHCPPLPDTLNASERQRFSARLALEDALLHDRLERLYGSTPGFEGWYQQLLAEVAALFAQRHPDLRELDAWREAHPAWFQGPDMLGYCAYVDRFGGTLAGVIERIPYLQELGVRYLYMLPFLRAREGDNDGGFAVASFEQIDPRLGTQDDLRRLTQALRAAGISLCSDLVLNHVADDHAWAQAAAAGDARYRDYFHLFADRELPDRYESTLGQIFPLTAPGNFTAVPGGWAWTTFYPYQWDLNYANREVFAEMALALLRLANQGVEAFRLDSAPFLWKRLGTDCRNQPEVHWILQALRSLVQVAAPGVLLKAEAIVPTAELPPYFGQGEARGRECQLAYQSSLMAASWAAVAKQDTGLVRELIRSTPELPAYSSWITYVRCHDDIGWNVLRPDLQRQNLSPAWLAGVAQFFGGELQGSFACGASFQAQGADAAHGTNGMTASLLGYDLARNAEERQHAEARVLLLHGLALCVGGLPMIYMGDELAQANDLSRASQAARALDGRWMQRPYLDGQRLAQRHDRRTEAGSLYQRLRPLLVCRRGLEDLAADAPLELLDAAAPQLLAFRRGRRFLAVANFSGSVAGLPLPRGGRWRDALHGGIAAGLLQVEPWGLHWLLQEDLP